MDSFISWSLFFCEGQNVMCHVDDVIFTWSNKELINKEIKLIGIKQPNEEHTFEFRDIGELSASFWNQDRKNNWWEILPVSTWIDRESAPRYLKGRMEKGMILDQSNKLKIDCYVDSDFAWQYNQYNDQDHVSTKSHTWYVVLYQWCSTLWLSKMQTQCTLSTMESEYFAVSQTMCHLTLLPEILKEIMQIVF